MNKEAVVGIYTMEYYLAVKKEWNLAICDALEGPRGHYAKWNKSVKNKYLMISLMCGIFKKKKQNQICRYREQISDCQSQAVEGRQNGWKESKGTNSCYKISHKGAQGVHHNDYG